MQPSRMRRYRRLSRERKKLKRRLVFASMTLVAGVCGFLYVVRDDSEWAGNFRVELELGEQEKHRLLQTAIGGSKITSQQDAHGDGNRNGEVGGIRLLRRREAVEVVWGEEEANHNTTKRLLSSSGCEPGSGSAGMTVVYVCGILFCFLGLAIVCDEFFQQSLEIISEVLKLTPDVAGATFLAAGSSAPELFTSLTDAFGDANSTGTGTIVGSAMFNILVIVALSAAVAGKDGAGIAIDWRPVCRDVAFYSYSILLLTLVFLDSEVQWWEGFIMVLSYSSYIVFMKYNARILSHCTAPKIGITDESPALVADAEEVAAAVQAVTAAKRLSVGSTGAGTGEDTAKVSPLPLQDENKASAAAAAANIEQQEGGGAAGLSSTGGAVGDNGKSGWRRSTTLGIRHRAERRKSGGLQSADSLPEGSPMIGKTESSKSLVGADQNQLVADEEGGNATPAEGEKGKEDREGQWEEEREESRFAWPATLPDQVLYVLGLPLLVAFTLTIPDCGKPEYRKWYVVSFLMSLLWIGTLTHFMVEWATAVGCHLDVSPIFMGLVVLAIGTSVPDALGSMIAAKSGEANMAIANAVGSNVFDILIGLGVPWFARGIILGDPMPVDRDGISLNVVILFCTGLFFVAVLAFNDWIMSTRTGVFLFALYVAYVIMVVIREIVL